MPRQGGFTLIELLVVVVIIGILAAVAIPNYAASQDRVKNASVQQHVHVVQQAVEAFHADRYEAYPDRLSDMWNDPGNPTGGSYPKTPWGGQQAKSADLPLPTVPIGAVIGPGKDGDPDNNQTYGAICYEATGSATDSYEISGVGTSGNNAVHLCQSTNK